MRNQTVKYARQRLAERGVRRVYWYEIDTALQREKHAIQRAGIYGKGK